MDQFIVCPMCLGDRCAAVRIDKKGRPYLSCVRCLSRAFLTTPAALASIQVVAPQLRAALLRGQTVTVAAPAAEPAAAPRPGEREAQ